jgi:glycosyltransferase XagB
VLQLRKAAIALMASPPEVACVQARLGFFNPQQNLLTKWFTLDYRMWFGELLPGLVQLQAPIPLGGTSNHFRKEVLLEVGAWDAFNVTEDADLGLRLYRLGYRTGVVDSMTLEEANSDFVNWIKQRSRWYKGYAQTLLVHLRDPRAFRRDVGLRGMLLACLFIGGTPLLAVMNSFFWTCVIVWFIFQPHFFMEVLPTLTYFLGMISWIAGNALMLYMWLIGARRSEDKLALAAVLSPLYWLMMAAAATKAALQLVTAPSYWEKTQHGLDAPAPSQSTQTAA